MIKYTTVTRFIVVTLGLLACLNLPAHALKSDRDQQAEIVADDVELDFKEGKRIFKGGVRVVQGTLRLRADKVVAKYNKKGELVNATAWGKPAKFRQRPDGKPDDVEGEGNKIFVNQLENTITLTTNAALKQGPNTARGKSIFYNMADDTMRVKGGAGGAKATSGGASNKTQTDPFFQDKPQATEQPAKSTETAGKAQATDTQQTSSADTGSSQEDPDKLPEKLVLPQKRPATNRRLSDGRSRLIITPGKKDK